MNFSVVKAQKRWQPEYGDLLYGGDYIVPLENNDLKDNDLLPIEMWGYNVWKNLVLMGYYKHRMFDLRKILKYDCPFSDDSEKRTYYYAYPVAIIAKDIQKYRTEAYSDSLYDMFWDAEWTKDFIFKNEESECQLKCSNVGTAFMGHGYNIGCLPTDGSSSKSQAKILLSNGDHLGIITWIWHNK